MTDFERRPSELLTASDELRQLIIENPGLPLLVFAGEDANCGDWRYMSCSSCIAGKGEFLDCMQEINEERCYTDRDDFQEDLEDFYADFDGNDEEFEKFVKNKLMEYEPYWRDCIIFYVNN